MSKIAENRAPLEDPSVAHLLHVEASPRGSRSASLHVAGAFLEAWQARFLKTSVDVLNVWTTALPSFDGDALDAKYAGLEGRERSPGQEAAWQQIGFWPIDFARRASSC